MGTPFNQALYPERRKKDRVDCDYQASVQDRETQGRKFSNYGRVLNLSASGILVVTRQPIQKDTEVIVRIAFPTGSLKEGNTNLDTNGNVIRSEPQSDGSVCLGIQFHDYKFL